MAEERDFADLGADGEDIAAYYDTWAAAYDSDLAGWDYVAPREAVAHLQAVLPPPATVLDAGCGTGLVGRALTAAGYAIVDGTDLSPKSLEVAAATGCYRHLTVADLQAPPIALDDACCDALLCVGVLTHLPDAAPVLREFLRLLRPGGWAVVTQRTDLFAERAFGALLDRLAADGQLTELNVSEPGAYLPGNAEYATEVGVHYVRFQRPG